MQNAGMQNGSKRTACQKNSFCMGQYRICRSLQAFPAQEGRFRAERGGCGGDCTWYGITLIRHGLRPCHLPPSRGKAWRRPVEDQGLPVHLRRLLQATQTGRPVWGPDAFKCSAEVNSASAKIFACGKNACTARSAARPLGGMALEKKKTSI